MGEILEECVGDLEKCWWENGTQKLFSPNLITLAEKLGFDVPLNRQPESESEWPGSFEKYTYKSIKIRHDKV